MDDYTGQITIIASSTMVHHRMRCMICDRPVDHRVVFLTNDARVLHTGCCDSRMWDPQWRTFPSGHRTVRYDLRGYGRSPLTPAPFSHARDLAALLDGLGVERAALVAASFGAQVALELAVARPDLAGPLVLAGASLPGHDWSGTVRAFFAEA